MKYMHFNSSCSYAGLANMLEILGYDTEDYKIALDMGLPYFMRYDKKSKTYQAGPMLQSAEWFHVYLKPRGFCYVEKFMLQDEVLNYLRPGMMLGIQVTPQSKHAVIFQGKSNGIYTFLNNKREDSEEPDVLNLSEEELLSRLPEMVMVGHLERCEIRPEDVTPYYDEAIAAWKQLRTELHQFVSEVQSPNDLRESMNRLFRPLFLDGLSMMKLLGEQELVECLEGLQKKYLMMVRSNQMVCLADEMDCKEIDRAIDGFVGMIERKRRSR